jgi:copper homeostasis protein CutC
MEASLEDVIKTGASRILTSGGQARATDAIEILARLVRIARERILIMPCGGVNADNVVQIIRTTLAQEVHSSAGASNPESATHGGGLSQANDQAAGLRSTQFEQKVATLVSLLGSVSHDEHAS